VGLNRKKNNNNFGVDVAQISFTKSLKACIVSFFFKHKCLNTGQQGLTS
jgi:hypothetical protein